MSLTRIEYGSLASSSVLNNNFDYLENKIEEMSGNIDDSIAGFSSQVETFKNSVTGLLEYRSSFIATGMIVASLIDGIPDGFLLCDGSELNVADFSELYDVIGTTFGSSDSTKFNLPDLRSKTLWGSGNGTESSTYLESGLPDISGYIKFSGIDPATTSGSRSGAFTKTNSTGAGNGHDNPVSNGSVTFSFKASNSNPIYGASSVVQPPSLVVNFLIKY